MNKASCKIDIMNKAYFMKIKIITFIGLIVTLAGCQPLSATFSKKNKPQTTTTETTTPKNNNYSKVPSSAAMNDEEMLVLQAETAAKEQAERRAEMARKRKAAQAAKVTTGTVGDATIVSGSIDEMPTTIEKLEEQQAMEAARKSAIAEANKEAEQALKLQKSEELAVKAEQERLEREKAEAVAAAKAKAEKEEKERLAKAKIEREKAEAAKLAALKAEAERKEKERLEQERLEREAKIAAAKAEQERLEREKAEAVAAAKAKAEKAAAIAAENRQRTTKEETETTKKTEEETEKERAARYANQNLDLYKEDDEKARWKLSNRKTFSKRKPSKTSPDDELESAVTETTSGERKEQTLVNANIPVSLAGMESDPVMSKIDNIPTPTLKSYYFPIEKLETAKAYCYISNDGSPDTTYWLMKSITFAGKSFLITEKYNNNFVMISSSRERINEVGAYIESFTAYESSGLGGTQAVEYWVEDDEGFRWNMDDGKFAMVSMNYNSSDFPNYDITSYRERHFLDKNGVFTFENRDLKTIVLEDRQTTVYVDNKNNEESYPSSCENHYAKGIGLVKYTINKRDKGFTLARTYQLTRTISYSEWQNLIKK